MQTLTRAETALIRLVQFLHFFSGLDAGEIETICGLNFQKIQEYLLRTSGYEFEESTRRAQQAISTRMHRAEIERKMKEVQLKEETAAVETELVVNKPKRVRTKKTT